MDPITLNKLLSVANAIEGNREGNQLSLDAFYVIIDSQGRARHLERRVKDVLRVFEAAGWLTILPKDPNTLHLNEEFEEFILAWNSEEHLLPMNDSLRNYPPYNTFLKCLKRERRIGVPSRAEKSSRSELGSYLKGNYEITFVAFDTFRTWAVSVGHAYLSPFDRSLHWGGEWDAKRPTLECFEKVCKESYRQTDKTSGYSNIGRVADLVCTRLGISFQAFERKMNEYFDAFSDDIRLAPATARQESSAHRKFPTVRPRKKVLNERLSRGSRSHRLRNSQWIEYRYLEDGIRLRDKLVQLMRWEVEN